MILALALMVGCGGASVDVTPPGEWSESDLLQLTRMRLPADWPVDASNPLADDESARALGSVLFFDPGLSGNGSVSCATCHKPERHFADGRVLAEGIGVADRHTPSIVGSQIGPWFFWDGRADSLWAQALGPIENPVEMGSDRMRVVRYVTETHRERFVAAFGEPPDLSDRARFPDRARPRAVGDQAGMARAWDGMDPADQHLVNTLFAQVGKSIAAYEHTLMPREAPLDRYIDAVVAGDPTGGGALTDQQILGLDLFVGRAGCVLCHNGPLLTDRAFHNNGVPETRPGYDPGRRRGAPLVTGDPFNCKGPFSDQLECLELDYLDPSFEDFQAAFKTPTLRYVAETAPYFHNGSHATLEEVVDFYIALDEDPPAGHRELTLQPLDLNTAERDAVVAFLGALTGEPVRP